MGVRAGIESKGVRPSPQSLQKLRVMPTRECKTIPWDEWEQYLRDEIAKAKAWAAQCLLCNLSFVRPKVRRGARSGNE